MDKKTLFRKTVAHLPVSVHKKMTKYKIEQLTKHLMSRTDVDKCEQSYEEKKRITREYIKRFPKQYEKVSQKINKVFQTNTRFKDSTKQELTPIRREMVFNWFAYGFFPDEFVFYDFIGVNSSVEKRREFVSETERLCLRFSANDFTQSLLADKAAAYFAFKEFYFRDALFVQNDDDYKEFKIFVDKHPVFIAKLCRSSRGQGIELIDIQQEAGIEECFRRIRKLGKVLLEELIEQNELLKQFNESSVNTVRVSTYLTKDGVEPVHGFFRAGRKGSFIDNAAAGGVFTAVDVKNGIINTEGCDEFGYRYETHPDSGVKFKGTVLPEWDKALAICREAALRLPDMKYLSFDLAYSVKGWTVVEINSSGQYLHQAGALAGDREKISELVKRMDLLVPYEIVSFK
ncbi:MAG: hypothetical protein IKK91_09025 [Ruminococcus sp.]|nr:hypothetical protein [Ruminococcus sp.]